MYKFVYNNCGTVLVIQGRRLDAVFFRTLCGIASAQIMRPGAPCGKFLQNVRPGAVNFCKMCDQLRYFRFRYVRFLT